jgi:aryl-alcohol dehydrogenase-like predicted oxidoreductase
MTGGRAVGRRAVPGTPRTASVFGLALDPPAVAPPEADRQLVALLRKARAEGVTVFDVSGSAHRPHAERLIATAFPHFDPELLVIVTGEVPGAGYADPSGRSAPSSPAPDVAETLSKSLAQSRRRLSPQVPGILEGRVDTGEADGGAAAGRTLAGLASSQELVGWMPRLAPDRSAFSEGVSHEASHLFSTELSLLEPSLATSVDELFEAREFGVFARDPFAGGRLDGTRFAASVVDRALPGRPLDLRALRAEFDPVLRLGFLSLPHRRTLAQAALQFLLSRAWVTSILLPIPRPERWEEIFGAEEVEPLTGEELRRLGVAEGPAGASRSGNGEGANTL